MSEKRIHIFDVETEPRYRATNKHCCSFFPDAHIVSHGWYPKGVPDSNENDHPSRLAFQIVQDDIKENPDADRLVITNIAAIHNGLLRKLRALDIPSLTFFVTTCWNADSIEYAIKQHPAFADFHLLKTSIVHSIDPAMFILPKKGYYFRELHAAFEALAIDNPFHLDK